MRILLPVALLLALLSLFPTPDRRPSEARSGPPPVATFSIVARDPDTGDLGVAVQSRFFGVGAVVPWARADVGALATQAYANTTYGPAGLARLDAGEPAEKVVAALVGGDAGRDRRQLGLVDAQGRAAAYTGDRCNDWAGHRIGVGYCCQGNILAGKAVVDRMAEAFEKHDGPLAERLVAALAAGQKAGGDKRGRQSAALLVVRRGGGYAAWNDRYIDIHVEDHKRPIGELARLLALWRKTMPRARLAPPISDAVREPATYGADALRSARGAWQLARRGTGAVYLGTRRTPDKPSEARILAWRPGGHEVHESRWIRDDEGIWKAADAKK